MSERPVPARFKFTRHQPVRGVGGIVLPEGSVGGIARRFQIEHPCRDFKPPICLRLFQRAAEEDITSFFDCPMKCVFQKFPDADFGNSRTAISVIPGQEFR